VWETQGTNNGWITRICDRLALKRGDRSQKNGGRPYASDQVVDIRARFNKDVELLQQSLKVGDRVLSRHGLPPHGSEVSLTRRGGSRRPSYAWRGSEKASECG
jgi:hypothetical protein